MAYNTLSLFSGAMGLDLGIEKAGFHIAACVEMDPVACQTIRDNSDIVVIEDDINHVTTNHMLDACGLGKEEITMVVGGPPCQAFSTAGARRSLRDFRGNVIIRFLDIVTDIMPQYFILENVRGIYSSVIHALPDEYGSEYSNVINLKGSVLYFLVMEFEKVGYSVRFSLFDTANYGVPQRRERLAMIGCLGHKVNLPQPTHSEFGVGGTKKWVGVEQVIGDLKESDMHYLALSEKDRRFISMLKEGENWRSLPKEVMAEAMGNSLYLEGGKTGFYRRLSMDKPSPTLVTSPTMPATMLAHPYHLRPLSIEEYARIQQFPDEWKFSGSIRSIYKQIGNAVPVGFGLVLGQSIIDDIHGIDRGVRPLENMAYSRYLNMTDYQFLASFNKMARHNESELHEVMEIPL